MGDGPKGKEEAAGQQPGTTARPMRAVASLSGGTARTTLRPSAPKPECFVGTLTHSELSPEGLRAEVLAPEAEDTMLHPAPIAPVLNLDLCVMYAGLERLPPSRHLLFVRVPKGVTKKQLGLRATFQDAAEQADELKPAAHTFVFDLPDERPCHLLVLPVCYIGDPSTTDVGDADDEVAPSIDDVEAFFRQAGVHLLDVTDDSEWGHARTLEIGYVGKSEDVLQSVVTLPLIELIPPVDVDEVADP